MSSEMLDYELIDEIKRIGQLSGREDLLLGFVRNLESSLDAFRATFVDCVTRGDALGAAAAAHALKGSCRQLGAAALGDLFAEIERSAKCGDYAAAERAFAAGSGLIAQSIAALKRA
jgi:HPt (histidine-containing phosphotransfer) domain-containing protein